VNKFNISRINTTVGILRISGLWDANNIELFTINFMELMGTDGWMLLDHSSDKIMALITELTPMLQSHLLLSER
jgi:hypothetical protein